MINKHCDLVVLSCVLSFACCSSFSEDANENKSATSNQQTVCSRTVPDNVSPKIDCTSPKPGDGYDICSRGNTPCGSVTGCIEEQNQTISAKIQTTYTSPPANFVAPSTLLPPMGTSINGLASGWFARGDGTLATGSCSLPPIKNIMATAISAQQFGNADWCGACAEIVGRSGRRVRVTIVDQCAACQKNWLDIAAGKDSPMEMLEYPNYNGPLCTNGEQPITWKIVPCETIGGIIVHYTEGFNIYTPAVQIRNHRLPLAKLEDNINGVWQTIIRQKHNQYYLRGSNKPVTITIRVTAMDGSTITGTFPAFVPGKNYEASSQF